ncbi:uncharacterized protein [Epargyreus clarus]|uniref:uncharacterized protein n=1 Tax=Epargyreus clarus TaxID=520877 RepID=UPI003C2F632D
MKFLRNRKKYLESNYIDKNVQDNLLPLNVMESIFCLSKYRIRNNFIHPRSYTYFLVSLLSNTMFVLIHLLHVLENFYTSSKCMYATLICHSILSIMAFICFCIINIFQSNNNVKLIIRIQFFTFTARLFIFGWSLKSIMLLCLFVKTVEEVYLMVHKVETTVILSLSYRTEDFGYMILLKNVRRVNRAVFRKMSACGLMVVDGAVPLRIFIQVANYTIVLLQFSITLNK